VAAPLSQNKKQPCLISTGLPRTMKHKIVKKDYYYDCGDGCCTEMGTEWYVDGEFVHRSSCEDNGWLAVLQQLGIEVELTGQDDQGEETWTL
jgi:hypothetical protein